MLLRPALRSILAENPRENQLFCYRFLVQVAQESIMPLTQVALTIRALQRTRGTLGRPRGLLTVLSPGTQNLKGASAFLVIPIRGPQA